MKDYSIHRLTQIDDAKRISDFFLSDYAFDDRRFTPWEIESLRTHPYKCLNEDNFYYWYAENENSKVIAAMGVRENIHKTGGYEGDYCAVHKEFRHMGIAAEMFEEMCRFIEARGARYLIIYTCDTDSYKTIRKILASYKFENIGHYPDYYYKGEGMLAYYLNLTSNA